jgi:hypothetical protein
MRATALGRAATVVAEQSAKSQAALNTNGEMELSGTVPGGLAGVNLTPRSYDQNPSGHGLFDSEPETVTIYETAKPGLATVFRSVRGHPSGLIGIALAAQDVLPTAAGRVGKADPSRQAGSPATMQSSR